MQYLDRPRVQYRDGPCAQRRKALRGGTRSHLVRGAPNNARALHTALQLFSARRSPFAPRSVAPTHSHLCMPFRTCACLRSLRGGACSLEAHAAHIRCVDRRRHRRPLAHHGQPRQGAPGGSRFSPPLSWFRFAATAGGRRWRHGRIALPPCAPVLPHARRETAAVSLSPAVSIRAPFQRGGHPASLSLTVANSMDLRTQQRWISCPFAALVSVSRAIALCALPESTHTAHVGNACVARVYVCRPDSTSAVCGATVRHPRMCLTPLHCALCPKAALYSSLLGYSPPHLAIVSTLHGVSRGCRARPAPRHRHAEDRRRGRGTAASATRIVHAHHAARADTIGTIERHRTAFIRALPSTLSEGPCIVLSTASTGPRVSPRRDHSRTRAAHEQLSSPRQPK